MTARFLITFIWLLLATAPTSAQNTSAPKKKLPMFVITLKNGELLKATIPQEHFTVVTKYGKLEIPLGDIWQIDFGTHHPPDLKKKIEDSITSLGSLEFKERDEATKYRRNAKLVLLPTHCSAKPSKSGIIVPKP